MTVDSNTTASASADARRRTWLSGGVLLIAWALIEIVATAAFWVGPGFRLIAGLVFAAAMLVFAYGIGRGGSVTARKPLGSAALTLLALWPLAAPHIMTLVPVRSLANAAAVEFTVELLVALIAVVAAVQIARARVVPAPWNLAPSWALIAVASPRVVSAVLIAAGVDEQGALTALFGAAELAKLGAAIFLGVVAILLATRPASRSVVIIPSEY